MGLTIRYKLSLAKNHSPEAVHDMVERAAQYARKIGCAEVSKPLFPFQVSVFSELFVHVSKSCFGGVPARAGWLMEAWPGEGCESAHLASANIPAKRRINYRTVKPGEFRRDTGAAGCSREAARHNTRANTAGSIFFDATK